MRTINKAEKWLNSLPEGIERELAGARLAHEFEKILDTTEKFVGPGPYCGICHQTDKHDFDCPVHQLKPLKEFIKEWKS